MKKFTWIDYTITVVVILVIILGILTSNGFRQTAGNQIIKKEDIAFQVFIRSVPLSSGGNPIIKGDTAFVSIRNVPYTDLKIIGSTIETKKTVIPIENKAVIVDDYSQKGLYDIVVTLSDKAQVTKDGLVIGGNKIKIGLPITLEGKYYKFNGIVSSIGIADRGNNEQ